MHASSKSQGDIVSEEGKGGLNKAFLQLISMGRSGVVEKYAGTGELEAHKVSLFIGENREGNQLL